MASREACVIDFDTVTLVTSGLSIASNSLDISLILTTSWLGRDLRMPRHMATSLGNTATEAIVSRRWQVWSDVMEQD